MTAHSSSSALHQMRMLLRFVQIEDFRPAMMDQTKWNFTFRLPSHRRWSKTIPVPRFFRIFLCSNWSGSSQSKTLFSLCLSWHQLDRFHCFRFRTPIKVIARCDSGSFFFSLVVSSYSGDGRIIKQRTMVSTMKINIRFVLIEWRRGEEMERMKQRINQSENIF